MDRFPEAFDRFEDDVDTDNLESANELISSFAHWAGYRYIGSRKQLDAIRKESEKRHYGFDWNLPKWIKKRDYVRFHSRYIQNWKTNVQSGKHRGLKEKQAIIINEGIRKDYSANRIQKELKNNGIGIRRKVLLRQIREMKMKSSKTNTQKYIPRRYRK